MKVVVAVKRVVDYNVKVRVKSDNTGVDIANVKMSMNPFDEIAVEEAVRLRKRAWPPRWSSCPAACSNAGDAAHGDGDRRGPRDPGADRRGTAAAGGGQAAEGGVDKEQPGLVIVGKQAIDDDCNQTGQMLAALGTSRRRRSPRSSKWRTARQGDARDRRRPGDNRAGAAGGDDGGPAPERAALRDAAHIMKAKKKQLDVLKPEDLGVDVSSRA